MRKSRIFLAVAAVLAAMTVAFVSCAHNDDEKETSVQFSFRMTRALVDDETIDEEETGYTLTASIDGKEKDEQTKPVQIGKETSIEFKDVRANSKIRVHLRLRNLENETIYFGDSEEITVKPGENNVSVTMHSSTIYVSEDGSDEKSGSSKESAMKTLESAFKKMSEISNDDIDWTIYVSGKISGTSTLESVSAKSVTITAKGDSAILDGGKETKDGATGSVLAIAENIEFPVTVSGITMQNGRSRIGAGFDMAGKGTATLIECTITDNEAINDGDNKANGGGIRVVNGSLVLKNTKVNNNKSEYNAGGIHFNGKELTMDDGSEVSGNSSECNAGGINQNGKDDEANAEAIVEIKGGVIKNNTAQKGGGLYISQKFASAYLYSGEISGNESSKNGAGVLVDKGTFTMSGGSISENKSTSGNAGGVYVSQREDTGTFGTFTMTGGSITANTSSSPGYGIFSCGKVSLSGDFTISGNVLDEQTQSAQIKSKNDNMLIEFTANGTKYKKVLSHSNQYSGEFYSDIIKGTIDISEDEIPNYFKNEGDDEDTANSSTSTYTRNTTTWSEDEFIEAFRAAANATGDDAVFNLQGNVTLTKNFISSDYGNENSQVMIDGQGKYGIEIRSSTASFKNVTFNNGAGSRVHGDTYQAFGMIYWNGGDGMLTFDSCSFSDSKTEGDVGGGALALFGKGSVTISACTFSRNSADHGAAIDIGGADRVSIEDSIFSENTAGNNCDIYCGGSEATVSGSGNTSDFANPYQYYDDSKACDELFSKTGTREQ